MPVAKKVWSFNSETWITCAWFECDRQAYELYKCIFHEHGPYISCADGEHVNFIFCSERHKQYFLHSHRNLWNLPPGYKKCAV